MTEATKAACPWCRECGSCDAGLPMSCTCGDCTCSKRCGHPRCLLGLPRQWAHGPDQQRPDSWYENDPDEGYEFDRDGNPR